MASGLHKGIVIERPYTNQRKTYAKVRTNMEHRTVNQYLQTSVDLVLEILESIGLVVCVVLASPLGFFRRLDRYFRYLSYMRHLALRGLFAPFLRSRLDYRMGNLQQAANILSHIAGSIEEHCQLQNSPNPAIRRMLGDIYSDLMQVYLLSGQLEDAALIVIRANQQLGLDRLPGNPSFDVKTAHVVKAGITAGKLLEDGGLATLMVKHGEEPVVSRSLGKSELSDWLVDHDEKMPPPPRTDSDGKGGAKIIPFPILR